MLEKGARCVRRWYVGSKLDYLWLVKDSRHTLSLSTPVHVFLFRAGSPDGGEHFVGFFCSCHNVGCVFVAGVGNKRAFFAFSEKTE